MAMATTAPQRKRMPGLVERHADEVDFLWAKRDVAARSAAYDLNGLARWDERLDGHLDGLRYAGDDGWQAALALLQAKAKLNPGQGSSGKPTEQARSSNGSAWGSAFGAAWVAVEQGDFERFAAVLDCAVGGNKDGDRAVTAALAFVSLEKAQRFFRPLVTAKHPLLQRMGIAAAAAHGHDIGQELATALGASDGAVRARAARAVGQLGRRDLLRALEFLHDDSEPACRYAAIWAGAVLGHVTSGQMLWSFCQPNAVWNEEAICLAAVMDPGDAPRKIREFAERTGDVRAALFGVAALGDAALVGWLFELMRTPDHARLAANALVGLTGIDLVAKRLTTKPPPVQLGPNNDPNDDNVTMDPDHGLPWPNVDALQTWWSGARRAYPAGTRFWLGKSIEQGGADLALRNGNQTLRRAAAWALAKMAPGRDLFDVRAPAMRQRAVLGRT